MENSNSKKTIIWIVVILVIVLLGTYFLAQKDDATPITETPTVVTPLPDTLVVNDQFPGDIVFVSDLSLDKAGFVAIHKDNSGVPGDIIGVQYFDRGTTNGQVKLTEKTLNGKTYYAMLHSDDGDKAFDLTKDIPLRDSVGVIIMKTFKATTEIDGTKG